MCEEQLKIFRKVLLTSSFLALTSASFAETINSRIKNKDKESNSIFESPLLAENPEDYVGFDTLKITVTGTRTERAVKDVPGALSSFDYDEINTLGSLDFRDLFKYDASISSQDFSRSDGERTYASGDKGNINIRGLEGNRVLTLIDGIPIPRFSYGRSGTFASSRLNYIDFNNLGNVEVLKGAGSSLYGSDAMGGVVSLRGLDPDDLLEEGEKNTFEISSPYNSQNNSYQPSIKFAFRENDIAGIFSASAGSFEELERKTDAKYINDMDGEINSYYTKLVKSSGNTKYDLTLENINKDNNTKNSSYYNIENSLSSQKDIRQSERTRISLGANYESDEDRFVDSFSAKIYTNMMENKSDYETVTLAIPFNPFAPAGTTGIDAVDSNTKVTLKQEMIGGNIQFSNKFKTKGTDQKLTYGFEINHNDASRIRKKFTDNVFIEDYKANPDSDILKYGFYVQDEIKFKKWELIPGLRYDVNNIDAYDDQDWYDSGSSFLTDKKESVGKPISKEYSNWSPSVAAIYKVNNNLNFYGKYSRSFRAPSWEDLNSSHINFTQFTAYTTVGNPDLKEETGDNYEIGLKGRTSNSDFGISGFLNEYTNFLDKSNKTGNKVSYSVNNAAELNTTFPQVFNQFGAPSASGTIQATEYQTRNIFDVQIWGIEADYKYHFSERNKGLSLTTSASYVVGENKTDDENLDSINPFTAISNLEYIFPNNKFSASLINTFVGVPTVSNTYKKGQEDNQGNFTPSAAYIPDSFITTDVAFNYRASERFSANLGVYNLFDTTYYLWSDVRSNGITGNDDTAYQRYAQPGTSIKAGFKWRF